MYKTVLVYDENGEFLGNGIKKDGVDKFQSVNIWKENETQELAEQLNRLNIDATLHQSWPDANDPEVQEILARNDFMPIELHEEEVVDEDESYLVHLTEDDPARGLLKGDLDKAASVIKFKVAKVPDPIKTMERTKAACEIVAKERAGLTS